MRELLERFEVDDLAALEPEELASHLIEILKVRTKNRAQEMVHFDGLFTGLREALSTRENVYPRDKTEELHLVLAEAWNWLEVQGLLIKASGANGTNGYRHLSRRARSFNSAAEFEQFAFARRFPKEALHPSMREKVWSAFIRGSFDVAVFEAIKAVEVAVRDAAKLGKNDIGVPLMRTAFEVASPSRAAGPLTDSGDPLGEQVAVQHLFAGAYGTIRNPHAHRYVDVSSPQEATEVVMLANLLLRIVDKRKP